MESDHCVPDEPRNGRSKHQPAGHHHPRGFHQTSQAIHLGAQVVKRPEQQDGIEALIGKVQLTSIADLRRERAVTQRLIYLTRDRVYEDHIVAACGEGSGVDARAATNIEHTGADSDPLSHQFLSTKKLQRSLRRPRRQPAPFVELSAVIRLNCCINRRLIHPDRLELPTGTDLRTRASSTTRGSRTALIHRCLRRVRPPRQRDAPLTMIDFCLTRFVLGWLSFLSASPQVLK